MRRNGVTAARVGVLGLGLLLGACGPYNRTTTWMNDASVGATDKVSNAGAWAGAFWGRPRPTMPEQSITIARLSGAPVDVAPLKAEEGDVWPVPEAPRSTLANPDAAMRGIPNYHPGDYQRPGAVDGRSEWQPAAPNAPLPPGLRSNASSPPPPPIRQPDPQANFLPPPGDTSPPPQRADGRVIQTPTGPAITTGGTDRMQSFVRPGGGTGTAIIDGNSTTLIGPNGQVQSVPTRP